MDAEPALRPLCESLDRRLLRYLRDVEGLAERRGRLERRMEQGWFSLSKARYSMGNKWVTSLQYGPQMVPLARVDVSLNEDGHRSFKVERVDSGELTSAGGVEEDQKEVLEVGAQGQVRRRKARWGAQEGQQLKSEGEPASDSQASEEKPAVRAGGRQSSQDPLRWFGVLVPQSLRDAQAAFREVMELVAEVATLQSRLVSAKAEYQALLRQKHKLIGPQSV
ncbi:coiled-coil domain-containing protein 115 [Chiloscyllium plagiosum]|uniref:coiled-coil domain-containing protein 115 n=1 Tax=Chiloscyllium plagiosum TaxID=36176 RepID=UPI001CB80EB3|nr:coiled-coil domain-containing protein 115 [Chiloscyllium plagiosum]